MERINIKSVCGNDDIVGAVVKSQTEARKYREKQIHLDIASQ